jgi:DNA-binding SARP family transcriptional activator/tetratricopeptide (TPR) repeat protein
MSARSSTGKTVRIELLGGFQIEVDGVDVAEDAWPTRRAAELVQLLALADRRRLPRDAVIEALWPQLAPDAGAANLRKAAHHARRALADPRAVVLRGGMVQLFPDHLVETDVEAFARDGKVTAYGGDLLPDAPYESWVQEPRERLRARYVELLLRDEQLERVVELEPTEELAYRALIKRELQHENLTAAIRWYARLRAALRRDLGAAPGAETVELYERILAGLSSPGADFVGRDLELARATAALRFPAGPAAIALRGPAGIGKSALCAQISRIGEAEGWAAVGVTVLESRRPYAPLVAVVERLAAADPALLDVVGDPARSALDRLVKAEGAEPGARLTRHAVIGAFRRLLRSAAAGRRTLLVIDDAHLADEATVDALQHLVLAGDDDSILLVLAYRPEPAPPSLVQAVARLAHAGRVDELDLGPLDRDDAAALVDAATPTPRSEETLQRIVALGQGNPFLTLELARSNVVGVPALVRSVRDAVAARFLDLDADTVAGLRRLALAGADLDATAALAVAGADEAAASAVLDTGLRSGALTVEDTVYRFRHELVRQALVEQLPPHDRVRVHREIAQSLARAGANSGLIASHWQKAGRPDEAGPWLLAAARQALGVGAYADALVDLESLLGRQPGHAEALRLRAEALDAIGDRGAPAAYAAAATATDPGRAQELRAKRALAQIKLGDPAGGLKMLAGVAPTTMDGRLAVALAHAGAAALGFGDPEVGERKAAEARRLALDSGDPTAVTVASWAQAAAAHARGTLRDSVRADLRDTSALGPLAISTFDGQLCITQRLLYGARPYAEVIDFATALEQEAQRLGAARGQAFAVTIRGEAKLLSGRLDDADADLRSGVELHRRIGATTGEAFALQRRAEVALRRGRQAEAHALLVEALALARESEVGFHLFDRIYGTLIEAAPGPDQALAVLEEAEVAVRGPFETCPGCRITLAVPAAIAAARAGDTGRADEWSEAAEYLANVVMRLPGWDAALEEVRGHLAQDPAKARSHFRGAAVGFARAGQPLDESRCLALAN